MPFAILFLVSIAILNTGVLNKIKDAKQENNIEVIAEKVEVKAAIEEVKPFSKQPEPIEEVVKPEIKQPEPIEEEVKPEIKQPEPIEEVVKPEIKQPEPIKVVEQKEPLTEIKETATEEVKINGSEIGFLKIVLYILGALIVIFGGFYFFSNRRSGQFSSSITENSRSDIEESYQPQEKKFTQEEVQPETTDPQPVEEEAQPETTDSQPSREDDEKNNK